MNKYSKWEQDGWWIETLFNNVMSEESPAMHISTRDTFNRETKKMLDFYDLKNKNNGYYALRGETNRRKEYNEFLSARGSFFLKYDGWVKIMEEWEDKMTSRMEEILDESSEESRKREKSRWTRKDWVLYELNKRRLEIEFTRKAWEEGQWEDYI